MWCEKKRVLASFPTKRFHLFPARLASMALSALASPSGASTLTLPGVRPLEGAGGALAEGIGGLPPIAIGEGAAFGAGGAPPVGLTGTGLEAAPGIAGLAPPIGGVALRLLLADALGDPPLSSGFEAGFGGAGLEGFGGGAAFGFAMSSR